MLTLMIVILGVCWFSPLVIYLRLQNYARLPGYNEKFEAISLITVVSFTIGKTAFYIAKRRKKSRQKTIGEVLDDTGDHLQKHGI